MRKALKRFLEILGDAGNASLHRRLDELERRVKEIEKRSAALVEGQSALLQAQIHAIEQTHARHTHRVESGVSAEAALAAFLLDYVPSKRVASVGAGDCLAGWEIVSREDAPLVCARDAEIPAGDFPWQIVLSRRDGVVTYCASHHATLERAEPEEQKTAFLFRDYELFARGLEWCAAALDRTDLS